MSKHVVILEARGLTKRYAGIPVVDHVSFQIDRQEILGCLGPNGAGKSTTVKMLVGLLDASEGQVLFHAQDIRRDLLAFKRRLGYVPEQPDLYSSCPAGNIWS
ncbi:MAG: ATP-binding cassette domain-containing protein [Bryobacteraceae bacterium]